MPTFSLPQQARDHWDREAEKLVAGLRPMPARPPSTPPQGSKAHLKWQKMTAGEQLERIRETAHQDVLGEFVGFEVHEDDVHEVLDGEPALALRRLAKSIVRHRDLRNSCSAVYATEHLMGWIARRRVRKSPDPSWTTDFMGALSEDVSNQTVLIPLEGIHISAGRNVEIGPVVLSYFTAGQLDHLTASYSETPEYNTAVREKLGRFQGQVYCQYECVAEEIRAQEMALAATESALDLLRMFEPAAVDIRFRCRIGRADAVAPRRRIFVLLKPDATLRSADYQLETDGLLETDLTEAVLSRNQEFKIWSLREALTRDRVTDLEACLLKAVSHYSHGVSSDAAQDRLVHATVAVESLLLKNETEPIQARLAQRVALLTSPSLETRKQTVRDVLKGYKLRSAYVHHGLAPADIEASNRLLQVCWSAIEGACRAIPLVSSKTELLEALDDDLLAPPCRHQPARSE